LATVTANRRPLSRYRAHQTARNLPPIPDRWLQPAFAFRAPPPLWQFVVLSMLLHGLFIALFGAPSGGSPGGRAMWGSMQVELRGLLIEREPAPSVAPRTDAAIREAIPPAPAPTREDRGAREGAVPMTPPAETRATATAPLGPAIVEVPTPFPRLLDRLPPKDTALVEPPALVVPPPTEGRDLRPPPRERPQPSPVDVPAPLPLTPSPSSERALAEPPPIAIPLAQPLPAPATPVLQPPPRTAETPQRAAESPQAAAPVTQPVEIAPVEVPAIPVPALESLVPPAAEAATAIEIAPLPKIEAAPAPEPMQPAIQPPAPAASQPDASAPRTPSPFAPPAASQRRPGARAGDNTASDYDPTAPALDPESLRARANRIAREGSGQSALLPFPMPPVPEKKSQLEKSIEAARKPDCRTAYQGLGLAAIVPLIANEFGEGNCRW
jgi:hypothetical protein